MSMARRVVLQAMVSPELRAWIQAHVALGEFADAGACIEDAFLRLHEMGSEESLDEAIDQAYKSGKGRPYTKADWAKLREDARRFASAYQRALVQRQSA